MGQGNNRMKLGTNPVKSFYENCSLVDYETNELIEEHHFVCGCGDCACHAWDGSHYGMQYGCSCHVFNSKKRKWELRKE